MPEAAESLPCFFKQLLSEWITDVSIMTGQQVAQDSTIDYRTVSCAACS